MTLLKRPIKHLDPVNWWKQFPSSLRLITKARVFASIGAGGVIYLTPLVFNQNGFSATQIASGVASAALLGTIARFGCGWILDKRVAYSTPIKWAALMAMIGDILLLRAQNYPAYLQGQLFIGIAAGLYWPAIELAIPRTCKNYPSNKGFALARSADALGISIGTIIGSLFTWIGLIRVIYVVDIASMIILFYFASTNSIQVKKKESNEKYKPQENSESVGKISGNQFIFLKPLIPIFLISLLSTGIFSLLQTALPIDLVNGGITRPPLSDTWSSLLIALQLGLLVTLQWPIGNWISENNLISGLRISLLNFGIGCVLLCLSSLSKFGFILIILGQIPLAIGLASFLPTATEIIIREASLERRGLAMAIFSQCFAISSFAAPLIAGRLLDFQGNGFLLWLIVGTLCFMFIQLLKGKEYKKNN